MSIGINARAHLRHAYPKDPALDRDNPAFDWDSFWKTGDAKHVPIREGCEATWFVCRRLTPAQFRRVMTEASDFDKFYQAIAYGLVAVEHFRGADGSDVTLRHKRTDLGERLTEESLSAIFAVEVFREIGSRIITLSTLDPTRAQG